MSTRPQSRTAIQSRTTEIIYIFIQGSVKIVILLKINTITNNFSCAPLYGFEALQTYSPGFEDIVTKSLTLLYQKTTLSSKKENMVSEFQVTGWLNNSSINYIWLLKEEKMRKICQDILTRTWLKISETSITEQCGVVATAKQLTMDNESMRKVKLLIFIQ